MDSVSSDGKAKNTCQIGSGKNMPNVEQLLIKMTETINTIRKKNANKPSLQSAFQMNILTKCLQS
jgi:hypothetical protein